MKGIDFGECPYCGEKLISIWFTEVGPNIEFDDNIDINYFNSTNEQWKKYFKN